MNGLSFLASVICLLMAMLQKWDYWECFSTTVAIAIDQKKHVLACHRTPIDI